MADIEKAINDLEEIKGKLIPAISRMYGSGFSSVFACEKVEEKIDNAVELLKEQQTKVMSIDDITPGKFVYVEYIDCFNRGQFVHGRSNGIITWAWGDGYSGYDEIKAYKKSWRAWDKQPTYEQMKAEPWKDGEQE